MESGSLIAYKLEFGNIGKVVSSSILARMIYFLVKLVRFRQDDSEGCWEDVMAGSWEF